MTIKEAVDELLRSKPYLEEALQDGLINITALARSIKGEVAVLSGKEPALGAIVMAIQRHQPGRLITAHVKIGSLMANITNIIVRSGIHVRTYENSSDLSDRLTELSVVFSKKQKVFYTFSQGIFETTIIFGRRALDDLERIMAQEKKISESVDQACITLYLPDENTSILVG
jgi:hypothetical protein